MKEFTPRDDCLYELLCKKNRLKQFRSSGYLNTIPMRHKPFIKELSPPDDGSLFHQGGDTTRRQCIHQAVADRRYRTAGHRILCSRSGIRHKRTDRVILETDLLFYIIDSPVDQHHDPLAAVFVSGDQYIVPRTWRVGDTHGTLFHKPGEL